jgi:hypothetical protein
VVEVQAASEPDQLDQERGDQVVQGEQVHGPLQSGPSACSRTSFAPILIALAFALWFEELLEEAFRLADEGKFGENGPIDQAAAAWATKWRDDYRLVDGPPLHPALRSTRYGVV